MTRDLSAAAAKAPVTEKKKEGVSDLLQNIGDVSHKDQEAIGKTTAEQTEFVETHAIAAADHDEKMKLIAEADELFYDFAKDKQKMEEEKQVETTKKEETHVSFEKHTAKPAAAAATASSLSLNAKPTTATKPSIQKPAVPKSITKNVVNNAKPAATATAAAPSTKPATTAAPSTKPTAASAKSVTATKQATTSTPIAKPAPNPVSKPAAAAKPAPVEVNNPKRVLESNNNVHDDDDDDNVNVKDAGKKQKLMSEKEMMVSAFNHLTEFKKDFDSKYTDVTQRMMSILTMLNDVPSAAATSSGKRAAAAPPPSSTTTKNNNTKGGNNGTKNSNANAANKNISYSTPREEPQNNNNDDDDEEENVDLTNDKQMIHQFAGINVVVNHLIVSEEANIFLGMDADVVSLILLKVVSLLCPKKSGLIVFDKLGSFKQGLDEEELELVHNLEMVVVFLYKFAEKEYPAIFKELTVPSSLSKFNIVMKFYQTFRDSAASQKTKDAFVSQVFPNGSWSVRDARLIATFVYFIMANVICKENKIELYASKVDLKLANPVPLLGSTADKFGNYKRVVNKKPEHKQPDSKQVEPKKPSSSKKQQQQQPANDEQKAEEEEEVDQEQEEAVQVQEEEQAEEEQEEDQNNHRLPEHDEEEEEQDDEPEDHSVRTGDSYKKFLAEEREKYLMMQKGHN
jgi:hypothetical protein